MALLPMEYDVDSQWVTVTVDTTSVTDATHLHFEKNDTLKRARTWGYFDVAALNAYTVIVDLYKNAKPKEYTPILAYVDNVLVNALISTTGSLVMTCASAKTNARVFVSGEWLIN